MRYVIGVLLLAGVARYASAADCDPNDPTLLKPDLVAEQPTHVRVLQRYGHRVVIFSTTIGNVGQGPLVIQGKTVDDPNWQTDDPGNPGGSSVTQATQIINRSDGTTCTHLAGFMVFHPTHHHWHFNDFADYVMRKDDPFTGEVVAEAQKISFCLIDVEQLRGFNTPITVASNCLLQEGIQGIDVGFADVYDSFLPGQLIDLDADPNNPVPGGNYYLVNTANPRDVIIETDDNIEDNSGVVTVSVPAPRGGSSAPPATSKTTHSPRPPDPLPSSHQVHNAPGQPHTNVPSFPHGAATAHAPHQPHQPEH